MTKSQAKVKEMIKSDFSALRSIVTHYMVVSKQPLVKLNRVHFRVCQTFSLTLNLTSADFCLLGFLTMRSVMLRDFVQGGLVVQNISTKENL